MDASLFWGEVAPCDHVVQLYENDEVFLDTLAGFVGTGIKAGDCCIVVLTPEHLSGLEMRLEKLNFNIGNLIGDDLFIPLHAAETLSSFMINNWPDEALFNEATKALLKRAKARKRRIRAAGEMVALLWEKGYQGATIQLEHLWNKVAAKEDLCLFCGYPRSGFNKDIYESVSHICAAHTKMLEGSEHQLHEVAYRETSTLL